MSRDAGGVLPCGPRLDVSHTHRRWVGGFRSKHGHLRSTSEYLPFDDSRKVDHPTGPAYIKVVIVLQLVLHCKGGREKVDDGLRQEIFKMKRRRSNARCC